MLYERFCEIEAKYAGQENQDMLDLMNHIRELHKALDQYVSGMEKIFFLSGEMTDYDFGSNCSCSKNRNQAHSS